MTDWKATLTSYGVAMTGSFHFVGTQGHQADQGLHFETYIDKDRITLFPGLLPSLAQDIALQAAQYSVDMVVGLALGAISLGQTVATILQKPFGFLTSDLKLRSAYQEAIQGKRIVLIEDIINTGWSTKQAAEVIQQAGGKVLAALCVWDRSTQLPPIQQPIHSLVRQSFPVWTLDLCLRNGPCARGVPIKRSPGHGRQLELLHKYASPPLQRTLHFVD